MRKAAYAIYEKQRRRSACASVQSDLHLCFHCLDCIISLAATFAISWLLSCFCSWAARFESYLVENPEDIFLWRGSKVKVINSAWVLVYRCTIWRICIWATTWQNQQNGMCAQRTLRSAWASTQSDQSSLSAWRNLWSLATHSADSKNSDLSLRWAHSHFVGFVIRRLI